MVLMYQGGLDFYNSIVKAMGGTPMSYKPIAKPQVPQFQEKVVHFLHLQFLDKFLFQGKENQKEKFHYLQHLEFKLEEGENLSQ